MEFKTPMRSKTVIFGLLQITVAVCAVLLADGWIQSHPRAISAIGIVSGIATIVLRFLTTGPIAWPDEQRLDINGNSRTTWYFQQYREIPPNTELRSGDEWSIAGAKEPVWWPIRPEEIGRVIPPFSDYSYRRPVQSSAGDLGPK
jgi:hypothetical protein